MSKTQDIPQIYKIPDIEAPWIRAGEAIIYKDMEWFPMDDTEILLDKEVFKLGEYRSVDFFVAKKDVEPYQRLYTKFDRNRYRYYQLKQQK